MLQLESPRLILRTAVQEDIPLIIDYHERNSEHLRPFEPRGHGDFSSAGYWEEKLKAWTKRFEDHTELRLDLFEKDRPGTIIGGLSFMNICQDPLYSCFMGYSLDMDCQGKGYMYEAALAGIKYVFEEYKLHKITAEYADFNIRSGKLLKKIGFRVEGFLKDNLFVDGKWQDHIRVGLLAEEFQKMHESA